MQIKILHMAGMLKRPSKHTRLREARSHSYATAKEAAAALGVPYGTYSGHESGSRGFNDAEAARYARFFRVKVSWLVYGEDAKIQPSLITPLKQIAHYGLIVDVPPDPKSQELEAAASTEFLIGGARACYKIQGHEMVPWLRPGSLVVCSARNHWEIEAREVQGIIAVRNCEPCFAVARPGDREGFWDVERFAAPMLRNVRLDWIEETLAILPETSWSEMSGDRYPRPYRSWEGDTLIVNMQWIAREAEDEPQTR